MAIRYAVANGNWSSTATWDGGTLPGSTDDVYANNFTVSIDISITVNSLKKISNVTPAITAGGTWNVTGAVTVTITAGIQPGDNASATALLVVLAGSNAVTITAPGGISGGAAASRDGIDYSTASTLTVNANVTSGTNGRGIDMLSSAGALVVNGNVTGAGVDAININSSSQTITVTGNVTGGTSSNADGIDCVGASNSIFVIGNVLGGSASNTVGVRVTGTAATVDVNGDVMGGGASTAHGIFMNAASTVVDVDGNVRGGAATDAYGVLVNNGAGTIRGSMRPGTATNGAPAISNGTGGAGVIRFSGDLYSGGLIATSGPNGFFPVLGGWCIIDGEDVSYYIFNDSNFPFGVNGTQTVLERYGTEQPVAADVREGTIYGASGTLTGTLAVPPTVSVAAGVPVDDTVGTAALSLSDLAAVTGAQIAAATTA